MPVYAVKVMGWMTVLEEKNKRDALRQAKILAPSCSLLPSDVWESHVKLATEEDIAWYQGMSHGPSMKGKAR